MEDILSTERKEVEVVGGKKGDCDTKAGGDGDDHHHHSQTTSTNTTVSPLTYLAAESEASADLTSSSKPSTNTNTNSGHPKDCLPYWFESPDSTSSFIIHFQTPPDR